LSGVRRLAGLPIRLRLTVAFAAAMALVLAASGLFLYLRVGAALDSTIDQGLEGRADDVAVLVRGAGPGLADARGRRLAEQEESFAQVLAPNGAVLDSSPGLGERQLLTGPELARAARETVIVDRAPLPDSDDPLRLLATPVEAVGGRTVVLVVGTSTEERAEALESLLGQLLLGGPLTLVAASLLGYLLAAGAGRAGV
jgi:two-component system OmpR family sensor kinase